MAVGKNAVTLTFLGDSKNLERTIDKVDAKTHTLSDNFSRGSSSIGGNIDHIDGKLGELDRSLGGSSGPVSMLGQLLGSTGSIAVPGTGGTVAAIGLLLPVIGAVAVELTGLVTGFAAAGLGAGAFALLAMPAIKKVMGALGDTKAQLDKLPKGEQQVVKGVKDLKKEFDNLSKAFQPQVWKLFNDALKIANDLLPSVTPMATAFANALHPLLKRLDDFSKSKGFKDFMKQLTSDIGPATTAIGNGLAKIGPALGQFFTLMSKKDVVNAINIFFTTLATTITIIADGIHRFMQNYDSFTGTIKRDSHDISKAWDALVNDAKKIFNGIVGFFVSMGHKAESAFNTVKNAGIDAWNWLKALPGKVGRAFAGLGHAISSPFVSAFQAVRNWWNSTLGGKGFSIPSWVPVFGGDSFHIPYFHTGGIVGGSGDQLAMLKGGEGVFTRDQMAAMGNGSNRVVIEWVGGNADDQFMSWLKKNVRIRGGDPAVLGR